MGRPTSVQCLHKNIKYSSRIHAHVIHHLQSVISLEARGTWHYHPMPVGCTRSRSLPRAIGPGLARVISNLLQPRQSSAEPAS